jgi:hypothetical protein
MAEKTRVTESKQRRDPKQTAGSSSLSLLGMTKDRGLTTGAATSVLTTKGSGRIAECPELIEIQAVGITTSKQLGEAAEAVFLGKASGLGFAVSKPWGESRPYDMVVDSGYGFWRVQIKCAASYRRREYVVTAQSHGKPYTKDNIDFIVAFLIPEDAWYVVPVESFSPRRTLRFSARPGSRKMFEKYREAWCLLECSPKARGWKDIPIHCRCPELSVRCAVCPRTSDSPFDTAQARPSPTF